MRYHELESIIKKSSGPVSIRVLRGDTKLFETRDATRVVHPISDRSEIFGIEYGENNIHSGILPSDDIQILP